MRSHGTKKGALILPGNAHVDWAEVLLPHAPLLETIVRGSAVYLALFLILRFGIRRQVGEMGITDLLVVVLIADAAQNAMANDYSSIADGLLLVLVIALWAFAIDWLGFRYPAFATLARPKPQLIVHHGRINRKNMTRALISPEELDSMLREQGVEDIAHVREARMEPDGRLSVITHGSPRRSSPRRKNF